MRTETLAGIIPAMGQRVLIVDDDAVIRETTGEYLSEQGFEIALAGDGVQMREAIAAGIPDVVLLDLNLPGDTGWDLVRGPALAAAGSPPVVITSATTVSPRRLSEFQLAGYLPKPFPLETLVAIVERCIRKESPEP